MKLSDYVVQTLAEHGVRDVFLVSGGGIMHLLDSIGSHPEITYHANFHEQAAVVAAEGYARRTGKLGVVFATVGPGAANAVSGLPGAWVDSIPILVIVGQVRQDIIADYTRMRQYGPQEANTLAMAAPVSKYAHSVRDPKRIRIALEEAIQAATSGRPGPAWLELPLDVQGANIDEQELPGAPVAHDAQAHERIREGAKLVAQAIRKAERPLLAPGNGVRLGGAQPLLMRLLELTGIPVAVPITAKDLVPETDPHYVGVFGTAGQRRANFAVQNCDALIALGSGLNVQKCGFNIAGFASKATKILVDIDAEQLHGQALKPDLAVLADVRPFLEALIADLEKEPARPSQRWLDACANWTKRYPIMTPDYAENSQFVNSYMFMDALSDALRENETFVPGAGMDTATAYQVFRVKKDQRVLISGWGSMGWDLPLTIGACIGAGTKRSVCVTGDGSIQWNVQELMTIAHKRLPINIFIFNNAGFASIRATQNNFFEGRLVGADGNSGVPNPDFKKLADAYGLRYAKIENNEGLAGVAAFIRDEPGICEVMLDPVQTISPKASAFRREDGTFESRPLEDMSPFLPREEVYENMHLFDEEIAQR